MLPPPSLLYFLHVPVAIYKVSLETFAAWALKHQAEDTNIGSYRSDGSWNPFGLQYPTSRNFGPLVRLPRPAVFQHYINRVFAKFNDFFLTAYLDGLFYSQGNDNFLGDD
jgi:hypothetical protein